MSDSLESLCAEINAAVGQPLLQLLADRICVFAKGLAAENARLSGRVTHLQAEISAQKKKIKKANQRMFGPSADKPPKADPAAASLAANAEQGPQDAAPALEEGVGDAVEPDGGTSRQPNYRGGRGQKNWGSGAEYREVFHQTPDGLCPCSCGGTIIDYDTDYTREVEPARYYIAVHKYAKYRCRLRNQIVGTKFESKILPRTGVSGRFMAQAMNLRYAWFMPWNRQQDMMRQQGLHVHRSTVARWAGRVAHELLKPIYMAQVENMLDQSVRVFMDETTVDQLNPGAGKVRKSQMFAIHRDDRSIGGNLPPSTVYFYRRTRKMDNVHNLLAGRSLIVHHDGHRIYGHLGRPGTPYEAIVSVDCWAHVRRLFMDEIKAEKAPHAQEIVDLIAGLYAIEETIRGNPPSARRAVRRRESVPILEEINARLTELEAQYLEKNDMGQALKYVLNRWTGLTLFVEDGRIELDNNPVERQFKHTILLRNNVLFIGSEEGGEAWAITASLAQTCKLNNVDFYRYLMWVFDRIITDRKNIDYSSLLPWNAPQSCRNDLPRLS